MKEQPNLNVFVPGMRYNNNTKNRNLLLPKHDWPSETTQFSANIFLTQIDLNLDRFYFQYFSMR